MYVDSFQVDQFGEYEHIPISVLLANLSWNEILIHYDAPYSIENVKKDITSLINRLS